MLLSTTFAWASSHFHLSLRPVDFRVVSGEPGVTQNGGNPSQGCDVELSLFCVVVIVDEQFHYFCDLAVFIRGSVDIENGDSTRKACSFQAISCGEAVINKEGGGT